MQTSSSEVKGSCSTESKALLALTPGAIKKVKEFGEAISGAKGKYFRLAVKAGGCSGYSYDFAFDDKRDDDIEIPADGLVVITDPMSLRYLRGCTLDYVETMQGAGFAVKNPNATGGCGCGSSFSA